MGKTGKYRRYSFMRNYDYEVHNKDGELISDLKPAEWRDQVIKDMLNAGHDKIWLIFHDKDKTGEGSPKPLHCHGVIMDKSPRSINAAKLSVGVINDDYDYNMSPVINDSSAIRYLTHTSNGAIMDKKYRYPIEELHLFIDNKEVFDKELIRKTYTEDMVGKEKTSKQQRLESMTALADDLLLKVSEGDLKSKLARDQLKDQYGAEGVNLYYKLSTRFIRAEADAVRDYQDNLINNGKSAITVFITGAGRSGKSQLAYGIYNKLCDREGLRVSQDVYKAPVGADGLTNDLISGYESEKIAVFDEIQPSSVGFERFMAVFDDHSIHNVQSRGKSHYFYAEYLFLIKAGSSIDNYLNDIAYSAEAHNGNHYNDSADNLKKQVYGRIPYAFMIKDKKLLLYKRGSAYSFDKLSPYKTYDYDRSFYDSEFSGYDPDKMDKLCEELVGIIYDNKG